MKPTHGIERFIESLRRRLHLRRAAHGALWTVLSAAIVILVIGSWYVLRGHEVPRAIYAAAAGAGALAALLWWFAWREDAERTARYGDRFFGLHDSLLSWLHFRRQQRTAGFYELQEKQTLRAVSDLNVRAVEWRPPRRLAMAAVALGAVAVALGFKGPSDAVRAERALEEATLTATSQINEELQELVRELDRQTLAKEERDELNPARLHELIDALRETKNQKEALRQYSRLEAELRKMQNRLQQRHDERLLQEAAEELQRERETRALADELARQKYQSAAERLASYRPENKGSLSEQQKQLARLKSASRRMAAALENRRARGGSSGSNRSASAQNASQGGAQSGQGGAESGAGGQSGGQLDRAIDDLANSVRELDDALHQAARQEREAGQCDADTLRKCQSCQSSVTKDLDSLTRYLKRMGIKCDASRKLAALCKACSQCQGGLCQSPSASPNAGGKKAGWGSNTARRDAFEQLLDNGQTSALQGIKSSGPSQTAVESADDGSGASGRVAAARKRSFERQFESFVSREDVPEQVKSGVKQYFQSIHQIEDAP